MAPGRADNSSGRGKLCEGEPCHHHAALSIEDVNQFKKGVYVLVGFSPVFCPLDTTSGVDQHGRVETYLLKLVVGLEALAASPLRVGKGTVRGNPQV